jgi:hypothetical protein
MDLQKTKPVLGDRFYDGGFNDMYSDCIDGKKKNHFDTIIMSRTALSDPIKCKHEKCVKHYIREHNIAVAYLRLHGFPTLQTIKHSANGTCFDDSSNSQTQSGSTGKIGVDRVSCITTDTVEVGSEHFFRLSRRVTIPDFCYSMAIFALENNKTHIMKNKINTVLDLHVAFPNIMKNGITSCTYIVSSNAQFKQHFTDSEFSSWQKLCMIRKINLLTGDTKGLKTIFCPVYCPDNTCDGQHGFISSNSYSYSRTSNVARCETCDKKICTKCFKWEHGKFACNATLDEMTAQTIADITKNCPGCNYPTEKNDGCNRMYCRCGTHWCWGCLVKLESADPYRHNGTICPNHLATDMNVWHPDVHLAHIHEEEDH